MRKLLGLFLIAVVGLAAQSLVPQSTIQPMPSPSQFDPTSVIQAVAQSANWTQAAADRINSLGTIQFTDEQRIAAHDAAIAALQARAPVPGPQGPQGVQGVPGNPSNAVGLLIYPSTLVYNPQNINTTSPPQFVMVSNQTVLSLPLAAPSLSGPFQLGGGGNCGALTSLPAGQNCVYGVQFKTGSVGAKVGFITINVGGLQLSVNLEGMGQ